MRWLLLKDLQILRRSPLLTALLVIYPIVLAVLIGFAIYAFVAERKGRASAAAPGPWFAVSCVLNMAWLFCWHYLLIELSVVVMLLLLLSITTATAASNTPTLIPTTSMEPNNPSVAPNTPSNTTASPPPASNASSPPPA